MVGDPNCTPDGTFARRGQVAHIRVRSSWGVTFGMFGFDLRFPRVAFHLVSDSIWCEGVGVGVGARGGSTWAGGDYLRGALGLEKRANLRTTNKARSHTHTKAQATQPLHRGTPSSIPIAFQHDVFSVGCWGASSAGGTVSVAPSLSTAVRRQHRGDHLLCAVVPFR